MNTVLLVSSILSWIALLVVGFLLLGTLRAMGLLSWRLEQLEATTPSRLGRSGLKVGKKAPDFTLPSVGDGERRVAGVESARPQNWGVADSAPGTRALHDFAGRKVLLVLTQSGCSPCKTIVPELNRLHDQGSPHVLVVNNGDPESTRQWAAEVRPRFPVLSQENWSLSKRYQVFATPFAFLIDEQGIITSKGIVGSGQHLGYVLTGAGNRAKHDQVESEPGGAEKGETEDRSTPMVRR